MVPRGDIIAVQQDISLGELVKVFEKAGAFAARRLQRHARRSDRHGPHPRPDRLHDRQGRGRPRRSRRGARSRCRRPRSQARSICRCRCRRPRSCARCCSCRRRCRRSTCSRRCRRRASIWRWWSTNTAAPTASFRWRTSSSRSSATSPTSTTRTSCPPWCASSTARSSPTRARASTTSPPRSASQFDVGDAAEEVDTLGGYLMTQVGRLPLRGELVPGPDRLRDRGAGFRSAPDQEGPHPSQQGSPDRARPRRPPPLQRAGQRARRSRRRRPDDADQARRPTRHRSNAPHKS